MATYTTEIPTRLGFKGLIDHADIYGENCYTKPLSEESLTHRTYKHKNAGMWCMSVYYKKDKVHSLELNTTYYTATDIFTKACKILEKNGPLTQLDLFRKLKETK